MREKMGRLAADYRMHPREFREQKPAMADALDLLREADERVVELEAQVAELEQERDRLARELYAAEERICGVTCASGPNGEPLACGYLPGHDGPHSWATLPTFPLRGCCRVEGGPA